MAVEGLLRLFRASDRILRPVEDSLLHQKRCAS